MIFSQSCVGFDIFVSTLRVQMNVMVKYMWVQTFMHTGLGIGIIAIAARALHTSGWSIRLMTANPWMVLGVGLVGSIGTMYATFATPPEK